jgi:probable phosphoglycerate mutase
VLTDSGRARALSPVAIRHGQTAWNASQRLQGHADVALDEVGIRQAQRLAEVLRFEDITAIYSSDLQRALHTAQTVAQACSAPVVVHKGLRERGFGFLEGHTYREIDDRWPADARAWRQRDVVSHPGGGESLLQFYNRCIGTALQLVSQHPGGQVVLVAHGGVLDCLYRAATQLSLTAPRSWQLGNATINRLLWTPQGLSLVGWNDDQHLQGLDADAGHGLD